MLTLDNVSTQKIELHTNSENIQKLIYPHCSLLRKIHIYNSNSPCLEHFLFYPNNRLVPLQILSYRESNVLAPISSLAIHKVLFSFSWLAITDSNFEIKFQVWLAIIGNFPTFTSFTGQLEIKKMVAIIPRNY